MPPRASIALLLLRLALSASFLTASINKFHTGLSAFVTKASPSIPHYLPTPLGYAFLHALPFAEFLVGSLLLLGFLTRSTATLASLLLISFILAVTGLTSPGPSPHPNLALLAIALSLALLGPGSFSLDHAIFNKRPRPEQ